MWGVLWGVKTWGVRWSVWGVGAGEPAGLPLAVPVKRRQLVCRAAGLLHTHTSAVVTRNDALCTPTPTPTRRRLYGMADAVSTLHSTGPTPCPGTPALPVHPPPAISHQPSIPQLTPQVPSQKPPPNGPNPP